MLGRYLVRAAEEVLDSIGVERAEWQSAIRINLLRIFLLVSLLLHPFELTEKIFACILDLRFDSQFPALRDVGLHKLSKDSMVDGEAFYGVKMLDQLQAHGAANPSVARLVGRVHEEIQEAEAAERVSAVDHDAWHSIAEIEILLAEQTGLLIDEVVDETVDFILVWVGRIFGLLEKVGGGILQRLHSEFE